MSGTISLLPPACSHTVEQGKFFFRNISNEHKQSDYQRTMSFTSVEIYLCPRNSSRCMKAALGKSRCALQVCEYLQQYMSA